MHFKNYTIFTTQVVKNGKKYFAHKRLIIKHLIFQVETLLVTFYHLCSTNKKKTNTLIINVLSTSIVFKQEIVLFLSQKHQK
jgi:hypothetical protein